jgi:hypothetical protein
VAGLTVVLIVIAFWRTPAALTASGGTVVLSAVLTVVAQVAAAVALWVGPLSTMDRRTRRTAAVVGVALGLALGAENAAEILWPAVSDLNVALGYTIVGAMALAYFVSGALSGLRAAVRTALVGYLVWYPTIWFAYFASDGTSGFVRAARAEGEYDDFANSGLGNFHVFLVRDYLGAGFYHVIFAVVLALLTGTAGTGLTLLVRRTGRWPAT